MIEWTRAAQAASDCMSIQHHNNACRMDETLCIVHNMSDYSVDVDVCTDIDFDYLVYRILSKYCILFEYYILRSITQ